MVTLSFTGDLLAYRSLIERSYQDKKYNFDDVFLYVKTLFSKSTYVVGNLETPIAGKRLGYTKMDMLFNTPKEFAEAIKHIGFDMVTTANNHCTDKGIIGVNETLKNLTDIGLDHTGIRQNLHSSNYLVKELNGIRIAFISYTYGTNPNVNGYELTYEDELRINITKKPERAYKRKWYKQFLVNLIYELPKIIQDRIHPLYPNHPYDDNVSEHSISAPENEKYVVRLQETIKDAKSKSDMVVFCLHAGGQFNSEVGAYTKYLVKLIKESGANIIICNHPHCVLETEWKDNCFVAYSLGNFTFTPKEGYFIDGVYCEYGVVLHIDIESASIKDVRFSVVKNIKTKDGKSRVVPIEWLYSNARSYSEKKMLRVDTAAVIGRLLNEPICNLEIQESYSYNQF